MLTLHPLSRHLLAPAIDPPRSATPRRASGSSVRYETGPHVRYPWVLAALVAVTLHAGLAFFVGRGEKPTPAAVEETAITVALVAPAVAELEDLDAPAEERPEARFDYVPVPRQMDVPTVTTSSDFIQALDFSSLVTPAKLSAGEIVIPETARRMSAEVKMVFDLAELDRAPEIIFQPELQYPPERKRSAEGATLLLEFVVDEKGIPHDPIVLESSDVAFEAPSRNGILRWRFRPGIKGGTKVSTRMRVPIVFRMAE